MSSEPRRSPTEPEVQRWRPIGMRFVRAVVAGAAVLVTVTACGGVSAGSSTGSGTVSGVVLSAPSCPVERAGSPCPPRPVPGAEVRALRGSSAIATTRGDALGRFTLRLRAGRYTLVARVVGGIGSTAQSEVTVVAGGTATVTLTVDSGIR